MALPDASANDVLAAGAIVLRKGAVLLVHRPRYDDWSFPKGKLDPGEAREVAAVREVAEETGLRVRLGPPLSSQRYPSGSRAKTVFYWVGRVVGDHDVSRYLVNDEIDGVRWVPVAEAGGLLSYPHDAQTLQEALGLRWRTRALVVLRHGDARGRKSWPDDDRLRPLVAAGEDQARAIIPLLEAYGVTRVVTSSSVRCAQTVAPYAKAIGVRPVEHDGLSEEGASVESVLDIVEEIVHSGEDTLLCTHRPLLPRVFDVLALEVDKLAPGELVVCHHRRGRVVATERHRG